MTFPRAGPRLNPADFDGFVADLNQHLRVLFLRVAVGIREDTGERYAALVRVWWVFFLFLMLKTVKRSHQMYFVLAGPKVSLFTSSWMVRRSSNVWN